IFIGPDNARGQRLNLVYTSEITMNGGGRNITFEVEGKPGEKVNVWQDQSGGWSAEHIDASGRRTMILDGSTRLNPPPKPTGGPSQVNQTL
ncbi:MAG: hypothetical protein KKC80_03500, partial [Candidatus Margulisbacteria bacterium]|nr:hypothetical protein [Candidatus Margulisiibacteriota bacterium]